MIFINQIPLRKATDVVEIFCMYLIINCFFLYIGLKCHLSTLCVLYIHIYIEQSKHSNYRIRTSGGQVMHTVHSNT